MIDTILDQMGGCTYEAGPLLYSLSVSVSDASCHVITDAHTANWPVMDLLLILTGNVPFLSFFLSFSFLHLFLFVFYTLLKKPSLWAHLSGRKTCSSYINKGSQAFLDASIGLCFL